MDKVGSVYIEEYDAHMNIFKHRYHNDNLAVVLQFPDGENFMTLSVNLPESDHLPEDFFFVKEYSENEPFVQRIFDLGIFEDTGRQIKSEFVIFPLWRIKWSNL